MMQQFIEFIGNNLLWVGLWIALFMGLIWNLFSQTIQGIGQIDPMDATRMINHEHAQVIDIRSPADFATGHILNALNIAESDIMEKKVDLEKLRKRPVIVCCQTGTTAARVIRRLKEDGFEAVYGLRGGIATWQRSALPLTRIASVTKASAT